MERTPIEGARTAPRVTVSDRAVKRSQLILAQYWKPLASFVSLFSAALAALPETPVSVGIGTISALPSWLRWSTIGLALISFFAIRFPRVAAAITRLLL